MLKLNKISGIILSLSYAEEILITSDKWSEKLPFSSLSRIDLATPSVTSQHQLIDMKLGTYKLFSSEPIPKVWLSILFDEGFDVLHNLTWHAYPSFDPPENFPPFVFAPGLYYTAALESAASAMEIAAIEGRNVAMLCSQYLRQTGLYQRFGKQTY